jgi:predicted transcriptional regulator
MRRLIDKGLVIKERPQQAYSLTRAGYELSR